MRAEAQSGPSPDGTPITASAVWVPSRDEAVEVLFRRHYSELLGLAYCLVGRREHAEDAVQDGFVSLYRHWNRLRERDAALTYLRSAVINRCRSRIGDLLRQRKLGLELVGLPDASAEEAALPLIDAETLVREVQLLPRRQREVLVCRYYLDLSVAETATVLEISTGSVKRHAHRAVATLSTRLEETA